MFKPTVQFSNYVSLAVMLLMVVALVAGQADASAYRDGDESMTVSPLAVLDNRTKINFEGELGEKALRISIAIVTDLGHFRGEDE